MRNEKDNRLGEERLNNQGCLMRIVEYNMNRDIIVEFQDEYKARVHTQYKSYKSGSVSNPYYKTICNVGMIGAKYPSKIKNKHTKEYVMWRNMLQRCFDEKTKKKHPTYKDTTCCDEWLCFENFYEWVHSQENFDKWSNNGQWAIDKDILIKGNKNYSTDTCCLVPPSLNGLFTKCDNSRGNFPIGVSKVADKFVSYCRNPFTLKYERLGTYPTFEEAFQIYREYKEGIIKRMAQEEYNKGNITKQCYDAMMNYEVEITD